jgi:hypothetical protein
MANPVKFNSVSTETDCINQGNFYMGVGNRDFGPTSSTGFYAGVTPPEGGYIIYIDKATGGPSVNIIADDSELISTINQKTGESFTTIAECFNYVAELDDWVIVNNNQPRIVTDGLVLNVDASSIISYPTTESVWYDLSGEGNNGTLVNGPTFNERGYLEFDGSDAYINCGSDTADLIQGVNNITLGILFKIDTLDSLRGLIGALEYGCTRNIGLTSHYNNFRFYNDTTTCYAVNTGATVQTGSWAYFVGTYDGTTTRVYSIQNGVFTTNSGTGKSGPTDIFSSNFRIMRGGSVYTEGAVAKAFAYTQTLTQEEILQTYYGGPIVTDGLVFAVDAGNLVSYESGSTDAYSLTGSINSSLVNEITYLNSNGGHWETDGVDDYISIPGTGDLDFGVNDNFTIETWVNLQSIPSSGNTSAICCKANCCGIDWYFPTANTMVFRAGIRNSTDGQQSFSSSNYRSLNQWYHLTFTYTPNQSNGMKLYVNGELDSTLTSVGLSEFSDNTKAFRIGGNTPLGGSSKYSNIKSSTTRMYNKALTADEVWQNYLAQSIKFK